MGYFIGIDVGGTTTTIAVGDQSKQIVSISEQFATDSAAGPRGVLRDIHHRLELLLGQLHISGRDVIAASLSTPGPATPDGILLNTPNLRHPDWNRFAFRQALADGLHSRGFDCPAVYLGDGQSAAFGEYEIRSGTWRWEGNQEAPVSQQLRSMFMVIVGTGLGGGEVRERAVVRGLAGRAGHAGHIFLPPGAFRYPHDAELVVGNAKATVESAVSLTGLTHQLGYRLGLPQWADHPLHKYPGTVRDKAKTLRELAAGGDPLALELFDDQAAALGLGLLSINYLGDYDLLVVGGGVCDLQREVRERYLRRVIESYQRHALDGFRDHMAIDFSACGDTAPVIGAVAYACHCVENR